MDNLQDPRDPISSDFVQERRPPMTTPLITLFIAIAALSGLEACAAGQLSRGRGPSRKETGPRGGDPARPQSLALGNTPDRSEGHNRSSTSLRTRPDLKDVPRAPFYKTPADQTGKRLD